MMHGVRVTKLDIARSSAITLAPLSAKPSDPYHQHKNTTQHSHVTLSNKLCHNKAQILEKKYKNDLSDRRAQTRRRCGRTGPKHKSTITSQLTLNADDETDNVSPFANRTVVPVVETKEWRWKDNKIRYQKAGSSGPPVLLVHGFGANCDHWRKNLPVLGEDHRAYAIDLLGYGYSDKPNPQLQPPNSIYNFENWSVQLTDFIDQVIGEPTFIICNSVGGIAALQASLTDDVPVKAILLLNLSLRMLHIKKQKWFAKPFVSALQYTLRNTTLGQQFFASVAKPNAVKNILSQCYHDKSAVTDELVDVILKPGLQPGAVDVFLDFICYSGGPLPEELLPLAKCPIEIAWGEEDPWEPIELGKAYGEYETVKDFIVLPGVGHCPQDEAPHLVNPLIKRFVATYS